jgi:hypothetical protein
MKKNIHIIYSLFAALIFYSCQNNDDVFLKELKQQNSFLEEQLSLSKTVLWAKASSNRSALPYCDLFMKQDSITRLFFKTLNTANKNNIDAEYASFKNKSDNYFKESQRSNTTKILLDDQPLLYFKNDTIQKLLIPNASLKRQLIKQHILQHYLIVSQLFYSASSVCGIRFDNPNHFGFRLTIEKNSEHFLLNLKCFDSGRFPHFEKLEFISLSKNNKENYNYNDDLSDIKFQIIDFKQEYDAIIIKTKALPTGFYRIYCNKLSISDNGRLVKQNAEFDFEITENQ